MSTRVVLAVEREVVRAGPREAFKRGPDIECTGKAGNGTDGRGTVSACQPDVLQRDNDVANCAGEEATRASSHHTISAVLVFQGIYSMYGRRWRRGALRYVVKNAMTSDVKQGTCTVVRGGACVDRRRARSVLVEYISRTAQSAGEAGVPFAQERRVLRLPAEGKSVAEIAALRHVEPVTVYTRQRT